MMLKNKIVGLLVLVVFTAFGCKKEKEPFIIEGLTPIYISPTDFSTIQTESPRPFTSLGNIVSYGKFIFLIEKGKGIHVIDNTNPSSPINIYFWNIPGTSQFTVKENILYADNSYHLLVIDISNFKNIKFISYTKNIFLNVERELARPPNYKGYFHCVRKEKGIHIGWSKLMILENPECETYQ